MSNNLSSAGKTFVVYCTLEGGYSFFFLFFFYIWKFADISAAESVVEDGCIINTN